MHRAVLRSGDSWLDFQDPVNVVQTFDLDQVVPKLSQVEQSALGQDLYAVGFISYEAASAFDPALITQASRPCPLDQDPLPLLTFGLFKSPVQQLRYLPQPDSLSKDLSGLTWDSTVGFLAYDRVIQKIKALIADGETYQVNYTHLLQSTFTGNPLSLFQKLLWAQPVERAIFIHADQFAICSASPELFFSYQNGVVTTRPMKGTRHRGSDAATDLQLANALRHSAKDQAENVMIVDMIRNDLGRIAEFGSIKTESLFDLERYPTVWQMTSTVTAKTSLSITEMMTALFPCASVTGAPKPRTMKIISELEQSPRGVYTGAIGIITPRKSAPLKAEFNVAIRTAVVKYGRAEYGIGSGIVWDSESQDEYLECQMKAGILTC